MIELTDAELDDLYERSKVDAFIAGSEVRQLVGEIRRHRTMFELRGEAQQIAVAQWAMAHPDSALQPPDRGDLIIWLLDQLAMPRQLPCPVCGGEAIHAIDVLQRTIIEINRIERTEAGVIDWKMEAQRANRLLDGWERVGRVDAALAKRVGDHIARDSQLRFKLTEWLKCYATDIFPEPDLKKATELLKANGMTIDSLSADMGRHVLTRVLLLLDAPDED